MEELYSLIAPHSFRLTKAEALDLPEKIYTKQVYEMSETSAMHYQNLKKNFLTLLDNGEVVDVPNAVSCLVRLQQTLSGYLPSEDGVFDVLAMTESSKCLKLLNK